MSVSSQELLRQSSVDRRQYSDASNSEEVPDERFRALLQVASIDENRARKNLYTLVEEEEITHPDGAASALLQPLFTPPPSSEEEKTKGCEATCSGMPTTAFYDAVLAMGEVKAIALTQDIEVLFEKMASCMIVMNSTREVETTLFIDNPSSVFFGTQITIREFSTAPKAFNVEISSSPQAIGVIDAARAELLSAFAQGNFNFSVHRLETQIQHSDERPVFFRKENDDGEQKGGREHE